MTQHLKIDDTIIHLKPLDYLLRDLAPFGKVSSRDAEMKVMVKLMCFGPST